MRVVEVDCPSPLAGTAYADVLAPSFPPDELVAEPVLRAGLVTGRYVLAVAVDGTRPAAAAVVERFPTAGALLLLFLATRPGTRGGGLGSRLLEWARDDLFRREAAAVLLAEIEHPAAHPGSPEHGDPAARLRFYARHGARAVDLPYFQPALDARGNRVYGLILALLASRDGPADSVASPPLRRFVLANVEQGEGRIGTDLDLLALRRRLESTDRLPLLPLDDPARLPLSARTPA
ncbi:GNAT family N-acetyltransferase [Micromonospora zhanjiangensis]|uniref:GNAT family N-acetyltransferase n=1 Tax=Micromonospora zhanjiangensis TaxID=1522057 RepID=A0ABV8KV19_9ACTN